MENSRDLSKLFDWVEYSVFGISLSVSLVIGVYYGFIKKQGQNTVEGYVLGQKEIKLLPMAMSLVSSFISGIALLGLGAEAYVYGTQYFLSFIGMAGVVVVNIYFFLPVFYNLQVISIYEYIERRFNRKMRKAASLLFVFYLISYIPIVIYAPALALNQVAKIDVHLITPIVCTICIFYTSVGGLKAVVLTDMLQTFNMIGAMIIVVVCGFYYTGGVAYVFETVKASGRWEWFNMDPYPTTRISFWSCSLGMILHWTSETTVNPSFVQRFTALPTLNMAKKSAMWLGIGVVFFRMMAGLIGLLAYAKYHGCDPVTAKIVSKSDQISPFFVLDVAGHLRGLPGLYMSGIFAAALSSMSTGLNTIAATVYDDLVLPCFKNPPSNEKASNIMKLLSVLFGLICISLIYLVERLGPILEMSVSLGGASSGILLAAFVLGIFVPFGNTKGIAWGGAVGMILGVWLISGAKMAQMEGLIVQPTKPFSIEDCPFNVTIAVINSSRIIPKEAEDVFPILKLSVFYYSTFTFLSTIIPAMLVSWLTGGNDGKSLDPELFSPYVHRYLKNSTQLHAKRDIVDTYGYAGVPTKEFNSFNSVKMRELNKTPLE